MNKMQEKRKDEEENVTSIHLKLESRIHTNYEKYSATIENKQYSSDYRKHELLNVIKENERIKYNYGLSTGESKENI